MHKHVRACVGPSRFSSDWPRARVAVLRGKEARGILGDDLGERPLTGPPSSPPATRIDVDLDYKNKRVTLN